MHAGELGVTVKQDASPGARATDPHVGMLGTKHLVPCVHLVGTVRLPGILCQPAAGAGSRRTLDDLSPGSGCLEGPLFPGMFSQVPTLQPKSSSFSSVKQKALACPLSPDLRRPSRPWRLFLASFVQRATSSEIPRTDSERVQTRAQNTTCREGPGLTRPESSCSRRYWKGSCGGGTDRH